MNDNKCLGLQNPLLTLLINIIKKTSVQSKKTTEATTDFHLLIKQQ